MAISQAFASEPREAIDLFLFLNQNSPWSNICWKARMDPDQSKLLSPPSTPKLQIQEPGPLSDPGQGLGSLRQLAELVKAWGTDGSFTQLLHLTGARVGLHHCTKEQFAPLVFAFASPMETASPEPNGDERSASCYSSALPSIRSAFSSPALNAQSGVKAAFSPGRAEQALSEKKDPQTNKTAGFVCEQTVNCDGVSFNLQIHLSTERLLQIDRADQKK